MTFEEWWVSREAEIAADESIDRNKLSILASRAWNAALQAFRDEIKQEIELRGLRDDFDFSKAVRSAHFALSVE